MTLLAPVLLAIVTPCSAQTTPGVKPKRAVDPADKVICHSESVTGSLASYKRTCRTRAQWAAEAHDMQDQAERMVDHGLINTCTAPGGC